MGWTPPDLSASSCQLASFGVGCQRNQGESDMNATAALPVVGVDLAKSMFQLAVADGSCRVIESHRLTRAQFERWFVNRAVGLVVMEACGSAHHWARWLNGLGIEVRLFGHAHLAHQCAARLLSCVRHCYRPRLSPRRRADRPGAGRSPCGGADAEPRHHDVAGRGNPAAGSAHRAARTRVERTRPPVARVHHAVVDPRRGPADGHRHGGCYFR